MKMFSFQKVADFLCIWFLFCNGRPIHIISLENESGILSSLHESVDSLRDFFNMCFVLFLDPESETSFFYISNFHEFLCDISGRLVTANLTINIFHTYKKVSIQDKALS